MDPRFFKHLIVGGLVASMTAVACGDDDDGNEPTPSATGGTAGTTSGSGGSSAGTSAGTAGQGGSAAGTSAGSAGSSAGSGPAGAGGSAGAAAGAGGTGTAAVCPSTGTATQGACFSGQPTKDVDYLNCCTGSQCQPFDNTKLSKLQNGKVPPLP